MPRTAKIPWGQDMQNGHHSQNVIINDVDTRYARAASVNHNELGSTTATRTAPATNTA